MVRVEEQGIEITVKNAEGDADTKATIIHQNTIDYEPKVSVIIPVYNTEEYLRECLDSVVNQTLKEIEIICVDDGSTDSSLEILKEYAQKDNRFTIVTQENMGSGTARNCGLNVASGFFVAFMDGDDRYPKTTTLETLNLKAFENNVFIAGGSVIKFNSETGNIDPNSYEPEYTFKKEDKIYYDDYQFDYGYWRFIYNRKFLIDNDILFPNLLRQQDPPFFIKAMSLAEKFYAIPEPTYAYRVSHKKVKWNEKKTLDVFKGISYSLNLCKKYKLHNLYKKICRRINAWNYRTALAESLIYENVRKQAISTLTQIHCSMQNDYGEIIEFDEIYNALLKSEKNNVIISVIIPVYNAEKYLERCLDSVINQTFDCIEILCVDDGSTDNSAKIIEKYCQKDSRVKLLSKKNGGLSSARNYGMKYAKGDYINFVDSDDWIEIDTLQKAISKMTGSIDIVAWGATLINEGLDQNYRGFIIGSEYHRIKINGQRSINNNIILNTTYTVWNKLFKSSILKKYSIEFSEGRLYEDNDFTIIYFAHCRDGYFLSDYLYNYVQRPNSIMEKVRACKCSKTIDNLYIFDNLYKHFEKYNLLEKYKQLITNRFYIHITGAYKFAPYEQKNNIREIAKNLFKNYDPNILGEIIVDIAKGEFHKIRQLNHIVVSLTSYPARINTVHLVIKSILNQSLLADKVILWLAPEQFPNKEKDLPQALLDLVPQGLTIDWYHDIKSYKKLIPTLKKYPDSIIVTADDDNIYHKQWLEKLYNSYVKYPNDIQAHRITKFFYKYGFEVIAGGKEYYKKPSFLNKLVGLGGVLYPPHCFNDDILNEELFTKLAPTNDDQWFWLQAVLKGTKVRVVENPIINANYVECTQQFGLTNINDKGEKLFWKDFKSLLNYYPILEKILKKESKKLNKKLYSNIDNYKERISNWYGKKINFNNPKTYNEKIQWMKIYDSTPIKTQLADKYLVRDWVKEKIGEEYLIPLLGVYDSFDEIDFDKLPNQFVIKCNHGCGYNIIVKNKNTFDKKEANEKVDKWMKETFSFAHGLELHYSAIKPKIIIEKYIENSGNDLYDYKFWCFNGKADYVQFISERKDKSLKMAFYNRKWEKQKFVYSYPLDQKIITKPDNIDKMFELAEKLAKGFPHVRVDFYRMDDGKIYFGEMTFTSASGGCMWNDERINKELGKKIKLPKIAYNIDNFQYYKIPYDWGYELQKIFSVKNEPIRLKHKIITITGIKFKIRRKDFGVNSFAENIFSIKNEHIRLKHKVVTIFGLKFKIKRKKCYEYSLLEKIFSVKNHESKNNNWYKVITVLGFKAKFRNEALTQKHQLQRLEQKLDNIQNLQKQHINKTNDMLKNMEKLLNQINATNVQAFENELTGEKLIASTSKANKTSKKKRKSK